VPDRDPESRSWRSAMYVLAVFGKNVMVVKFSRKEASDLLPKNKRTGTQVSCWSGIVRKHR
jgi:hypothetical protein